MQVIHTSFKKRKARKPNAKQRELAAEWESLLKKYETKQPVRKQDSGNYTGESSRTFVRDTRYIPSLGTGVGVATRKESPRYTGTMIKGIGTMHKSNSVPVFSDEEAVDIATMRRN